MDRPDLQFPSKEQPTVDIGLKQRDQLFLARVCDIGGRTRKRRGLVLYHLNGVPQI